MSRRTDGTYRCDRSGRELENGGVHECAVVTRVVTVDGQETQEVYHFCYEDGCDRRLLSKRNLADLQEEPTT